MSGEKNVVASSSRSGDSPALKHDEYSHATWIMTDPIAKSERHCVFQLNVLPRYSSSTTTLGQSVNQARTVKDEEKEEEDAIVNRCVGCGEDMGECNPRQYCCKTYCPYEDQSVGWRGIADPSDVWNDQPVDWKDEINCDEMQCVAGSLSSSVGARRESAAPVSPLMTKQPRSAIEGTLIEGGATSRRQVVAFPSVEAPTIAFRHPSTIPENESANTTLIRRP